MFLHVWRWQRATWTTRGELPVWFVIRLARHRVVVGHFAVCGRVSVLCSMMGPILRLASNMPSQITTLPPQYLRTNHDRRVTHVPVVLGKHGLSVSKWVHGGHSVPRRRHNAPEGGFRPLAQDPAVCCAGKSYLLVAWSVLTVVPQCLISGLPLFEPHQSRLDARVPSC